MLNLLFSYKASVVPMVFLTFPEEVKNYPVRVFKGFEKKELDIMQVPILQLLLMHMIYLIIVLIIMILLDLKLVNIKFMLELMLEIIINWKVKLMLVIN